MYYNNIVVYNYLCLFALCSTVNIKLNNIILPMSYLLCVSGVLWWWRWRQLYICCVSASEAAGVPIRPRIADDHVVGQDMSGRRQSR